MPGVLQPFRECMTLSKNPRFYLVNAEVGKELVGAGVSHLCSQPVLNVLNLYIRAVLRLVIDLPVSLQID
jgi:hypothetical protein